MAFMERSRSPRRSRNSAATPTTRTLLPVRSSSVDQESGSPTHFVEGIGLAGVIPPLPPPIQTWHKPTLTGPLGSRCLANNEFYDYQKINGLQLPRSIQTTAWTLHQNIAGCDPLTLPLSLVLRGCCENPWLRIMASGKAVYLVPMGEVSQITFVTGLLTKIRHRGMDDSSCSESSH